MTEQHPLTDRDLAEFVIKEIRIAYDKGSNDMLDRVLEWLKATKSTVKLCPSVLADQIEIAMRPQEDKQP